MLCYESLVKQLIDQSISDAAAVVASYVVGPTTSPRRYLAYTSTFSTKHTLRQLHDFLTARLKISREDMRLWKLKDEVS